MAWLRRYIDKNTYLLFAGVWSALSSYIVQTFSDNVGLTTLIVTAGSLVIAWIGVESSNAPPADKSN